MAWSNHFTIDLYIYFMFSELLATNVQQKPSFQLTTKQFKMFELIIQVCHLKTGDPSDTTLECVGDLQYTKQYTTTQNRM